MADAFPLSLDLIVPSFELEKQPVLFHSYVTLCLEILKPYLFNSSKKKRLGEESQRTRQPQQPKAGENQELKFRPWAGRCGRVCLPL